MMKQASVCAAVVAGMALLSATGAFAGPITPPPGPVVGTYKTLAEVEPRVAINAANTRGDADSIYKIVQPGSYYLTGNVAGASGFHGIEIGASNVTIDLMGFSVVGVAGSLDGITTSGSRDNLTVRNGTVAAWGGDGVDLTNGGAGLGAVIESVHVVSNGARGMSVGQNAIVRVCTMVGNQQEGIVTATNATIESCIARENGTRGFFIESGSVVIDSIARDNGGNGFLTGTGVLIRGCIADENGEGGFLAGGNSTVASCSATSNAQFGIATGAASTITGSNASFNQGTGLSVGGYGVVVDCVAHSNLGIGIVSASGSTISRCSASFNQTDGIRVSSDCLVLANACEGNGLGGNGAGIFASSSDNRIERNNCTGNDWGFRVTSAGNFITANTSSGNGTLNWDIASGNICLVVSAATSGLIAGNSGGVAPGSTDPNANFTY